MAKNIKKGVIVSNKDMDKKNSRFDDVFGTTIIILYAVGLFAFCCYIYKSVSDMARRNQSKEQKNIVVPEKTARTDTIDYTKALKFWKQNVR